jgi:hypothetical protein
VSLDDQIRQALDRALVGVRGHLESDLRAFAQDIQRAATEDRARAIGQAADAAAAEVRQKAHAQLAEIREAARRHTDELRRSSEVQISDLKRALADTGAKAHAEIEDARRLAQAQVDDVQRVMDQRVADVQQRERQSQQEQAARLAQSVRMLDDARSLGEVLEVLGQSAAREAERAAVMVARGTRLVGWTMLGFGDRAPHPDSVTLELEGAGLAGNVVRTGSAESRSAADTSEGVALPPFARDAGARDAIALPVHVGGAVVAVLYADTPARDAIRGAAARHSTLDVLARHASKVLEALTVQQAVGLSLPRPMARASHDVAGLSHDRSVQ